MSEKYKSAMDKIVLSDERKAKIKAAASAKIAENKTRSNGTKFVYVSCATVAAACLAVYIGVSVVQNNTNPIVSSPDNEIVSTFNPPDEMFKSSTSKPNEQANDATDIPKSEKHQELPTVENKIDAAKGNLPNNELPAMTQNDKIADENLQEPQQPMNEENSENDRQTAGGGLMLSEWDEINNADINKIRSEVGYDFALPAYMPQGYEFENASLLFGELVQITYCSGDDKIIYRTEKCSDDISGDYNTYETEETVSVGDTQITLRQNDGKCFSAIWNDGAAHALSIDVGIEKSEVEKIIESIK